MIFALRFAATLLVLALVLPAHSQTIPGADDPELRAAAQAWLAGEDLPALQRIAGKAREGNLAARLFLGRLERRYRDRDFGPLTPERQREIFYDESGLRFGYRRWDRVAELNGDPLALALDGVSERDTEPSTRLEYARLLFEYGEREHLLKAPFIHSQDGPTRRFVAGLVTPDDYAQRLAWRWKWNAKYQVKPFYMRMRRTEATSIEDIWGVEPWTEEDEAEYQAAVADERIVATQFLLSRILRCKLRPECADRSPEERALRQVPSVLPSSIHRYKGKVVPVNQRMRQRAEAAADWLLRVAPMEPMLRPVVDLCNARCPETSRMCVHTAVAHAGFYLLSENDSPLEALVPQDDWLASSRARTGVLARSTALDYPNRDLRLADQCYVQEYRGYQARR